MNTITIDKKRGHVLKESEKGIWKDLEGEKLNNK